MLVDKKLFVWDEVPKDIYSRDLLSNCRMSTLCLLIWKDISWYDIWGECTQYQPKGRSLNPETKVYTIKTENGHPMVILEFV